MKPITYCLSPDSDKSDAYYDEIASYTDDVIIQAEARVGHVIDSVMRFITLHRIEAIRTREEYLLDLLTLAVLWRSYTPRVERLPRIVRTSMIRLYDLRRRNRWIKPAVDRIRGILSTIFLTARASDSATPLLPSRYRLDLLVEWLAASGEYRQEVQRMRILQRWSSELQPVRFLHDFESLLAFAAWFERTSADSLGTYTKEVEGYLEDGARQHRWREDVLFCARGRVEYHASMVGAEIMNRALRSDFLLSDDKVVLLPTCMRARHEGECRAIGEGFDALCTGCTTTCRVHQLQMLGRRRGFTVRMITHSSDFSRWIEQHAAGRNVGVVGVACPLNLMAGGLELKAQNVPAQCVLLEQCGCRSHWHAQGTPTTISIPVLERTLDTTSGRAIAA